VEELPLTTARLVSIWWAFVWRFVVLTFAGGIALGIVMGIFAVILRIDPHQLGASVGLQLLLAALGCGAFYLVLRWVLVLKWPEFRIVLVRRQD
jgi:hypothetical protein